ncbi:MAG: glutaredoxin domain-containing protein [Candidatus Binatia bacterium]
MIDHQRHKRGYWYWFTVGWLVIGLTGMLLAAADQVQAEAAPTAVNMEVFSREGCPHCDAAKRFLAEVERERPDLHIIWHDVQRNPAARARLQELAAQAGVATLGVPAFYVQGQLIVGFSGPATTGARLKTLLETDSSADAEALTITVLGTRLTVADLGLPLFTFVLGLLDGFNPCSMWVLILMLSMLASLRDRRRMFLITGVFVLVQGLAYFAFLAAWLNLFLFVGLSRVSEMVLGGIACVAGLLNLKDFWAFGWGVSLSIPQSAKPGLYARLRRILVAQRLRAALLAAVILAVFVQVIELICTSGFPALYTRILTLHQLDRWSYYGYLLLYNLAYMLDDAIVLTTGVLTLSQRRLQEKEGRWLKLLSGLVMLGLGLYLLVRPG